MGVDTASMAEARCLLFPTPTTVVAQPDLWIAYWLAMKAGSTPRCLQNATIFAAACWTARGGRMLETDVRAARGEQAQGQGRRVDQPDAARVRQGLELSDRIVEQGPVRVGQEHVEVDLVHDAPHRRQRVAGHPDVPALPLVAELDKGRVALVEDALQRHMLDVVELEDVEVVGAHQSQTVFDAVPHSLGRIVEVGQAIAARLGAEDAPCRACRAAPCRAGTRRFHRTATYR